MSQSDLFRNLLLMAAVDGRMSEAEFRLLSHRAAEWGITDEQFEQAIQDAIAGKAELTIPTDPAERTELLKEMIRIMAADGHMAEEQKQLFALAASVLDVSMEELNRLIDAVLTEDYCG
jgi:uncharacterized tellurite resistance protein B-like protein